MKLGNNYLEGEKKKMAKKTLLEMGTCLCCGDSQVRMMRVGPMLFCTLCSGIFESDDNDEVDTNSAEYQKWIKVYKEI